MKIHVKAGTQAIDFAEELSNILLGSYPECQYLKDDIVLEITLVDENGHVSPGDDKVFNIPTDEDSEWA